MKEFATEDQANYYSGITCVTVNGKRAYELKGKFLNDLLDNAFSGTSGEDGVKHIEYFLKIVDLINLLSVNHERLRLATFPISLIGNASKWNNKTKWPTCNSNEDGFYNGGELPGIVRVGYMTYFQDHEWYDGLMDEILKDEALEQKSIYENSWGDASQSVINFYAWLKRSFENFHELDYELLVKLQDYWWKENDHECSLFANWRDHIRGPYANFYATHDPYLYQIVGRNDKKSFNSDVQEDEEHKNNKNDMNYSMIPLMSVRFAKLEDLK
nr:hypothetical protein [Tanacetum cinerariifolium]